MFFYPDSDQQNYAVTQFVNSDLGGTGLANMVKEAAAQAIKVFVSCLCAVISANSSALYTIRCLMLLLEELPLPSSVELDWTVPDLSKCTA